VASRSILPALCALGLCLLGDSVACADSGDYEGSSWDPEFNGRISGRWVWTDFPDDSLFRDLLGPSATDLGGEARLNLSLVRDTERARWDFQAGYQFIALHSDTVELARDFPGSPLPIGRVINDDRRWFDLTHTIRDEGTTAVVQRLDRMSVGLTTASTSLRFGRQAITWGNGLVFTPMDIFNPFDPAAIDTEFKLGDDMLYGQYLFANGNDLQAVAVVRRDPLTGEVERSQGSLAAKLHGFAGGQEYDLLAAEHYDDTVLGAGGAWSLGGAIVRGDLTWTRTERDDIWSAVLSASYSWTWNGRNVTGLAEYFYNGFGQSAGEYSPEALATNPDLLARLERGELFTLGRHYLAASATIEVSPLVLFTPNVFVNLGDPSALLQVVTQYDWTRDLRLWAALSLPMGAPGTEYGGIETGLEGRYLSSGIGLFTQLNWYF
jgi:hypothetical protein